MMKLVPEAVLTSVPSVVTSAPEMSVLPVCQETRNRLLVLSKATEGSLPESLDMMKLVVPEPVVTREPSVLTSAP